MYGLRGPLISWWKVVYNKNENPVYIPHTRRNEQQASFKVPRRILPLLRILVLGEIDIETKRYNDTANFQQQALVLDL